MTDYAIVDSDILTADECHELEKHEAVIESGLQTFYSVGTSLLAIRDNRLYRQSHRTFEDYCRERWNMARSTAYQMIDAAVTVTNLSAIADILPTNEAQARPLTQLEPEEQKVVWEVVQQTAPAGKVTAQHVKSVVNVLKEITATGAIDDGTGEQIPVTQAITEHLKAAVTEETYERLKRQETYVAEKLEQKKATAREVLHSSETNEWYTPARYIEAARKVLGNIDLDPASCEAANKTVNADMFFAEYHDGLKRSWHGRVWLNPPYGRDSGESNQALWSEKLIQEYEDGNVTEAVLLVNAATDTDWFQKLWDYTICFTNHRIRFESPNGDFNSPTHGNAFIYFGEDVEGFTRVFNQFGVIARQV